MALRPVTTRAQFKARLAHGPAVLAPLCLDPLTARLCQQLGYEAGYLSGGALGYSLAVSEALLTLDEVADVTTAIARRSTLPLIVDGGVGFGDPVHAARAMWDLEAAGAAAVELEDQVAPKRVSHHRGVEHLVPVAEMVAKVEVAVAARRDPDFLVIARTGAVRHEGFEAALERCNAYAGAGADLVMLFPETSEQWRSAPERLAAPAVAMTGHGPRSAEAWGEQGWRLVIDPFTGQVTAVDAVRRAYAAVLAGTSPADQDELMAVYRDLPVIAGLEELYDIERATTEPGT